MIKNELNKIITLTHTPTSYWLLQQDPDAFILYHFYCYTASWQESNELFATNQFVMNSLKWGKDRFQKAKKILISSGIVSNEQIKDEEGKIAGTYVIIRTTIPSNRTVANREPNNSIYINNKNIVKTTDDLEEVMEVSPELHERMEMKKALRAKKKTPFLRGGSGFNKPAKLFTPKKERTVADGRGIL